MACGSSLGPGLPVVVQNSFQCDALSQPRAFEEPEMGRSAPRWQCISGCGACCRLDPDLRPEALEMLDAEQRQTYLAMVGDDGWCVHYDTGGRRCRIYDNRPDFCRVSTILSMLDVREQAADALAISFCRQQIRSESGGRGRVMRRFLRALRQP
jgi:Fe-S-cluster containining protein